MREWTREELDEMAYRKALAMNTLGPAGIDRPAEEVTHSYVRIRRQVDGSAQVMLFSYAARQEWMVGSDGTCTCPHFQVRCQQVPGAVCGHVAWLRRRLESGERMDEGPSAPRTAAVRAELASIFA